MELGAAEPPRSQRTRGGIRGDNDVRGVPRRWDSRGQAGCAAGRADVGLREVRAAGRPRRGAAGPRPCAGEERRTGPQAWPPGSGDLVGRSEATARSRASAPGAQEPAFGGALARAGAGGGWRRAGGKLGQLERRPRGPGPGPVEAPRAAGLWEAASGGSAAAADKGLRGGRAGFPSSDPEARRPLPTASPASGAGAGLARHLLHIDAAAASRASPAPGMQWQRRAGPRLERGRARSRPPVSASALLPRWGSAPGSGGGREPSAASACAPVAPAPPRGVACSVAQSPILVPPLPTWVDRDKPLSLPGPASANVKCGWGWYPPSWSGDGVIVIMGAPGFWEGQLFWALPTQGLGHFFHYPSKAPTRGSESGGREEGGIHSTSKTPCTYCVCQACGWCSHTAAETNTTVPPSGGAFQQVI